MNYEHDDIHHVIRAHPYMQLRQPNSALVLLRRQAALIDAWGDLLPRYRTLLCARLDFAYEYLRCLGALDALLLQDLLTERTWRGIVIGAWLAALEPRREFRAMLLEARPRAPHNQWVVDLAVAAIDGEQPQELAEHLRLMATIRRALAPIPRPATRLTRPDVSRYPQIAGDAAVVREIYRTRGADAVFAHLAAHPWKTRLPSSSRHPAAGIGHDATASDPTWSWGMHPPFSTDDLLSWTPPSR